VMLLIVTHFFCVGWIFYMGINFRVFKILEDFYSRFLFYNREKRESKINYQ